MTSVIDLFQASTYKTADKKNENCDYLDKLDNMTSVGKLPGRKRTGSNHDGLCMRSPSSSRRC